MAHSRKTCSGSLCALASSCLQLRAIPCGNISRLAVAASALILMGMLTVPAARAATATDRVRLYFNATYQGSRAVIELDLYGNESPLHVANFFDYLDDGEYDTSFIHRTRSEDILGNPTGFFLQGGSFRVPHNTVIGSNPIVQRDPVDNEFDATNGLSNVPGSIAAARPADPDGATSGWFINQSNNSAGFDPAPYTVFGQVTKGMGIVDIVPFLPNDPALNGTAFESTPFLGGGLVAITRAVRIPLLDGDYDFSGSLDVGDYVAWRDAMGSTTALHIDGNADGTVNHADLAVWRKNMGAHAAAGAGLSGSTVPEPGTLALAALAALLWAACCRRVR